MDFAWPAELTALAQAADAFADDMVSRFGSENDSWINGYSKECSAEMGARGWIGLTWPEPHGGGRPPIERLVIAERLIARGVPIAASWFADRQMGPCLIAFGTPDQQARYLPEIRVGRSTWCIGMSEPNAGSDLASLTTAAHRDGDEFVINGQKIWTSFGATADYCYLICRTSAGAKPHEGLSEIIVPLDLPGIEIRPIKDMTGNSHFCEVFFTDVRVGVENLVGVEGQSWRQTMRQLEHERGGIDRLVSNYGLYLKARAAANNHDPLTRQEIARLETGYRVGRLQVLREGLGQAPGGFSAATKCLCTEHEVRVADFVSRVLGPVATLWDQTSRGLCYAPAYTIMGGTSSVMRNIVAERILGLPR